jgi:hypothetical protein
MQDHLKDLENLCRLHDYTKTAQEKDTFFKLLKRAIQKKQRALCSPLVHSGFYEQFFSRIAAYIDRHYQTTVPIIQEPTCKDSSWGVVIGVFEKIENTHKTDLHELQTELLQQVRKIEQLAHNHNDTQLNEEIDNLKSMVKLIGCPF